MHTIIIIIVLKSDNPNKNYKLQMYRCSYKNSSFWGGNRKAIIALCIVEFDAFRPVAKLKSKHT